MPKTKETTTNTPKVPKEALALWTKTTASLLLKYSETELESIGWPLNEDDIIKTDFIKAQSRYVRNDTAFGYLVEYAIFVKSKQLDIEFRNANKLHWLLGMNSELKELEDAVIKADTTNINEEVGDILFFLLSYAMEHKILFSIIGAISINMTETGDVPTYRTLIDHLYRNTAVLSDIEKGTLTSEKPFYVYDLINSLIPFTDLITAHIKYTEHEHLPIFETSIELYNSSLNYLIKSNKVKLGWRYEAGFTATEDHGRDTGKEYESMKDWGTIDELRYAKLPNEL